MKRVLIPRRELLDAGQVRWLGAALVAVQLPHAYFLPVWVTAVGLGLVLARLGLEVVGGAWRSRVLERVPSYVLAILAALTALAIKGSYGHFLGRDPCVAFLFVLVGIKFIEARTARDGTLLVCLASFLLITPFFYAQSVIAGVAAVPGLLLILASLQVLAPPAFTKPHLKRRDPLRRAARLLAEGAPLALMLFVMFPRLQAPLWGLPSDVSAKSGLSDHMRPGSVSDLSLSDAVAFRVDFATPIPAAQWRYWRGPVFSRFDGREWTAGGARGMGQFVRSPTAPTVLYTVTLEPSYKSSLFALDLPASLPRPTDPGADEQREIALLTRDQQLLARTPIVQPARYSQLSLLQDSYPPATGRLAERERAENLELPPGSPRTRKLATSLRAASADDGAYARSVLTWFREEAFYYTLSPPRLDNDVIDGFLFDTRRGFCEHYASAFVVLMRAAGVPARIVTGYQGGEINPNGGYLIVRQSDAHAWAEALINDRWQRFDPTAAVAPSRIELGLGAALPSEDRVPLFARVDEGWIKNLALAWDALNYDWRRHVVGFGYAEQRALWQLWQVDRYAAWQVTLVGVLVTAAWGGGLLLWFLLRHHQRDDRVTLLWNAVCRRLARAGLPREPHEGPLAYVQRASARWPAFAAAFAVIGESYAALRYGAPPTEAGVQDAALARLKNAIKVLPRPHALRKAGAAV